MAWDKSFDELCAAAYAYASTPASEQIESFNAKTRLHAAAVAYVKKSRLKLSQPEPDDSSAGSLVLRVTALETRVEDGVDRTAELRALTDAQNAAIDALHEALYDLRASIKAADRNHWRREIASRLWSTGTGAACVSAGQCVKAADELLAALEAREKEESK